VRQLFHRFGDEAAHGVHAFGDAGRIERDYRATGEPGLDDDQRDLGDGGPKREEEGIHRGEGAGDLGGIQHLGAHLDSSCGRATVDGLDEAPHRLWCHVRAEQQQEARIEPPGNGGLEGGQGQVGTAERQGRAEIGDGRRARGGGVERWMGEAGLRVDLRAEQRARGQAESPVALAAGTAEIDRPDGTGPAKAAGDEPAGQERVDQRQQHQPPFAPELHGAHGKYLTKREARAGDD
jgi:hypothetical protein